MAGKRRATSDLNHDNWDETEESEDPGTFKPVPPTELPNRVFAKAKRTLGSSNSSGGGSPFAAFGGFASGASTNPFSFLQRPSTGNFGKNSESLEKRENGKQETKSAFFQKTANNSLDSNSLFSEPKQENKQQESMRLGSANSNPSPLAKAIFGGKTLATESKTERKESATPSPAHTGSTGASNSNLSMQTSRERSTRTIEYYRQLQSLNESLLKWMQLHLSKNSCCDFTPVFNDYKKHLDTLNVTYPVKKETLSCKEGSESVFKSSSEKTPNEDNSNTNAKSCFKLTNFNLDETDYGVHFSSNTTNTSTFSFGHKTIPVATSSGNTGPTSSSKVGADEDKKVPPPFSFGLKNVQSSPVKSFSFASTPSVKSSEAEGDDAEYVPPKNDFTAVSEEGAIYSKRCKLFFKKDENFVDKGVGTLYLKPLDGKTQLLVRADTNLGNILLNIMLSASLPTSRTGKNNVLLVCVPNPPVDAKDSKAIPMLIRVKTSEDADELLEVLEKNKS